MDRQQKAIFNPAVIAFEPSHLSWTAWIALGAVFFNRGAEGTPMALLGFTIGLTFMQAGFVWGQYKKQWERFFIENRKVILDAPSDNKPTKTTALTYLLAVVAKNSYTPVYVLLALSVGYIAFKYVLDLRDGLSLLIGLCATSGIAYWITNMLTHRLILWGEARSRALTDFSYVFDYEVEQ